MPASDEPDLDDDGFVESFARMNIGGKKDKVGDTFDRKTCTHNPNGHIIIRREGEGRCHVCTETKGSKVNARTKYFCKSCEKPVCGKEKGRSCMDIHSLINPKELKPSTRGEGQNLVREAIKKFEEKQQWKKELQKELEMTEKKLASTL